MLILVVIVAFRLDHLASLYLQIHFSIIRRLSHFYLAHPTPTKVNPPIDAEAVMRSRMSYKWDMDH